MDTERRALNDEERALFSGTDLLKVDWKEHVGTAALNGGVLFLFGFLVVGVLLKLIGVNTGSTIGLSTGGVLLIFVLVGPSSFVAYDVWFEFRGRRDAFRRRQKILNRSDLIVEFHEILDCKLVLEPEHGQCMFFVRTSEGEVIFVLEGQELQEDWEERPLAVLESVRPRRELKIIRLPETSESILEKFVGPEVPVHDCFEMTLAPSSWPASGQTLESSWDDLPSRYRLNSLTTPAS